MGSYYYLFGNMGNMQIDLNRSLVWTWQFTVNNICAYAFAEILWRLKLYFRYPFWEERKSTLAFYHTIPGKAV